MRKCLFFVVLLSMPSVSLAQLDLVHEPGPTFAVKAGMFSGLTPSTLRENYNNSYSAGAWASMPISSRLVIRPNIEFGQLAFDVRSFLEDLQDNSNIVSVTGGDYRSLAIGIDAVIGFNRSSMVAAYGILGGGYYSGATEGYRVQRIESVSVVEGESESGIALTGGGGIRADMNEQLGAFAEVKFVYGLINQNHLVVPVGVGIFLKL